MLLKNLLIILCYCVYSVISVSSFINKGQRAELFELLDNSIPIVNVHIPNEEFLELKDRAGNHEKSNYSIYFPSIPKILKNYIEDLQKINLKKVFPNYNMNETFPQLHINKEGYSNYNIDEIVQGFDYESQHYDDEGSVDFFVNHVFRSNENFKFLEIIETLKAMKKSDTNDSKELNALLDRINNFFDILSSEYYLQSSMEEIVYDIKLNIKLYKELNYIEAFPESDIDIINEKIPQLQVGEDGYAEFDDEEILLGFNFDLDYYKNKFPDVDINDSSVLRELVYESNEIINYQEFNDSLLELTESEYLDNDIYYSLKRKIKYDLNSQNENIPDENNSDENIECHFYDETDVLTHFKTKNATMSFELNGVKSSFDKVTLSLSGVTSRGFTKPNYNVKIRGGKSLYGRSQFKFRSDSGEPTYLRSKLVADIHNRLGLKSISANYIQFYINEEYMGLYIIMDTLKQSWVESVYGDKDSSTLYQCKMFTEFIPENYCHCINENEDIKNHTEYINFLKAVENAESASDLEDIFEIDHFLYEMAIEYLLDGWDHLIVGHNFYMYKQPNGKWIYLTYDFDFDFGKCDECIETTYKEFFPNGEDNQKHIINILILQDTSRFDKILNDVVNKVFNPSILYPRIDELKQFIRPYVEKDKIKNSNGTYPGVVHDSYIDLFTLEEWDSYSEFNNLLINYQHVYGLKYWILMKYRFVCKNYNMECDPLYMDENYEYYVNENLPEYPPDYYDDEDIPEYPTNYDDDENPTEDQIEYPSNYDDDEIPTEDQIEYPTNSMKEIPTEGPVESSTKSIDETPTESTMESSTKYPSSSTSFTPYVEEETVYDIDEPIFSTDEESSSDEEDLVESVKSPYSSPTTTINAIAKNKTTITKTKIKTKTII